MMSEAILIILYELSSAFPGLDSVAKTGSICPDMCRTTTDDSESVSNSGGSLSETAGGRAEKPEHCFSRVHSQRLAQVYQPRHFDRNDTTACEPREKETDVRSFFAVGAQPAPLSGLVVETAASVCRYGTKRIKTSRRCHNVYFHWR